MSEVRLQTKPATQAVQALRPGHTPSEETIIGSISMSALEFPERLNAAVELVDKHVARGRGQHTAIVCGNQRISCRQLAEKLNRAGNAFRAWSLTA